MEESISLAKVSVIKLSQASPVCLLTKPVKLEPIFYPSRLPGIGKTDLGTIS